MPLTPVDESGDEGERLLQGVCGHSSLSASGPDYGENSTPVNRKRIIARPGGVGDFVRSAPKTTFREAFIRRIDESDITLAELSRRTGVPKPTLDKLHQRKVETTSVANAIRIAAYFGQSVEEFMGLDPDPAVSRLVQDWASLTEGEREIVDRVIRGLFAQRDPR